MKSFVEVDFLSKVCEFLPNRVDVDLNRLNLDRLLDFDDVRLLSDDLIFMLFNRRNPPLF